VKKKPPPDYTLQDLQNAVFDVQNGLKTYSAASEIYNVPVSVIFHRIKGRKCSVGKLGPGRLPDLPRETEETIAKCLKARAIMGYPCDKEELKDLIQQYVQSKGLKTRFTNNRPGNDWYYGFMRRNPELSFKKPEHLQKARQSARDPFVVYDFFDTVKEVYAKAGVNDTDGSLIFNADESGFSSDPSRLKAIGCKGKALNRVSGGSGRDNTTVLACVSAVGQVFPPLIVFKGPAIQPRWISDDVYPGTMYAATSNGWMEEATFFYWFKKMFIPTVNGVREKK